MTAVTLQLFGGFNHLDFQRQDLLLFIYLASFSLYGFHRLWGLRKIPDQYCSERHLWAKRHFNLFIGMLLVAVAGMFYALVRLDFLVVLPLVPAGIVAIGYTVPIIPIKKGWIRLRDLPMLKIFLIGLVVAYITVWLPYVSSPLPLPTQQTLPFWFTFAERVLFIVAITLPFDVRDVVFDQRSGLTTIPIRIGLRNALLLGLVLLGLAGCFTLVQHFFFGLRLNVTLAILLSYAIAGFVVWNTKPSRSEYFYSLLVEGTMLIQWLLVFGAEVFFVSF